VTTAEVFGLPNLLATLKPAHAEAVDIGQLVHTYSSILFRVAHSILRNRSEAEDVVQEVFVRVLEHRARLPEVREMRVWLVRIAGIWRWIEGADSVRTRWTLCSLPRWLLRASQLMKCWAKCAGLSGF